MIIKSQRMCVHMGLRILLFPSKYVIQILIVFYSQSTIPDCVYKLNKLIVWATQSGFDWGERRGEMVHGPRSGSWCPNPLARLWAMRIPKSKIRRSTGKSKSCSKTPDYFLIWINVHMHGSLSQNVRVSLSEVGQIKDGCQLSSLCHPMYKNGEARSLKNSHKKFSFSI